MEPDTVLNLFDSSWFYLKIFEQKQPKTSDNDSSSSQEQPNAVQENDNQRLPTQLSLHTRSKSDQLFYTDVITSPDSVLNNERHLETILSQKEYSPNTPRPKKPCISSSRKSLESKKMMRRKRLSKSMSQLEYEELKGFVDLGFVFHEEDKEDSALVGMIPGLQRLGHENRDKLENDSGFIMRSRPYLSEAWNDLEKEREERLLMSWRIPVVSNNEVHIKENLKCWAHTVASAVRC